MFRPIIVAHRGFCALYPENTLLSIERAINIGAMAVELDLQMTADRVPVLFHDADLSRLTGHTGLIMHTPWQQIQRYSIQYTGTSVPLCSSTSIATLAMTIELFKQYPAVSPCIELKRESIDYFGLQTFIDRVLTLSRPVLNNTIFLSFSAEAISYLHSLGIRNTAWVLEHYDACTRHVAEQLQAMILVVDINKLSVEQPELWQGPWKWMVYETDDPGYVQRLAQLGADYIETNHIGRIAEALPQYFK